ncbi:efflux transporter, RND family, MFP subunit [Pedosphaera parvula Ellin514]|uniref:Efflux transporter, RND family, MFP subunit n=2 Tax=Pedosphaera TaxID=1032526 RepID=B9XNE4_PEDPL|nr:efflux transporter, RND family, MFP subunit [Pedosphaera parvula Ellin514]
MVIHSNMKKWLIIIVVLAAGGAGYFYWNKNSKARPAGQSPARPTTAIVESRSIQFVLTSAGDIGPADQVSVRPEINGRISLLPVDIGDQVKKGELLFALDDQDLQTDRASRLTDIEGAKLTVEKTHRNYERNQRLSEAKLISQEVFDDGKTDYDLAQNALERSQKALRVVDDQLSKTRIVAPFDCTVLTRPISIGQAVSGSGGFNSGTEVMTIANLKEMIVNAHVNQADVTRMKMGQTVDIEVEAVPGLKFKGTVQRIAPQATIKNNIKGFAAQIFLKNIDPRVRPGMTANLTIPLISADNVLAVPLAAVFTEQGDRYVYVKKEDNFEVRPIQIGVADFQYAEIVDGLASGETVSLVRPSDVPEPNPGKKKKKKADDAKVKAAQNTTDKTTNTASSGKRAVL